MWYEALRNALYKCSTYLLIYVCTVHRSGGRVSHREVVCDGRSTWRRLCRSYGNPSCQVVILRVWRWRLQRCDSISHGTRELTADVAYNSISSHVLILCIRDGGVTSRCAARVKNLGFQNWSRLDWIGLDWATSHQTHRHRSYRRRVFTGHMTQPTVSKHWRKRGRSNRVYSL